MRSHNWQEQGDNERVAARRASWAELAGAGGSASGGAISRSTDGAKGADIENEDGRAAEEAFEHGAAQAWGEAWAKAKSVEAGAPDTSEVARRVQGWEACAEWARAMSPSLEWGQLEAELEGEGGGAWMAEAIAKGARASEAIGSDAWAAAGVLALGLESRRGLSDGIERAVSELSAERQRRRDGSAGGPAEEGGGVMSIQESEELMESADRNRLSERLMEWARTVWASNEGRRRCPAMFMALQDRNFARPGRFGSRCALSALRCLGLMAEGLGGSEREEVARAWGKSVGAMLGAAKGESMNWLCASLGAASAQCAGDAPLGAFLGEAAAEAGGELSAWALAGGGEGAKAAVDACVLQLVSSDVLSGKERQEDAEWVQALGLLVRCMGPAARRSVLERWEEIGPEERCVAWAVRGPEERARGAALYEAAARGDVARWAQPLASQIMAQRAAHELGASVRVARRPRRKPRAGL